MKVYQIKFFLIVILLIGIAQHYSFAKGRDSTITIRISAVGDLMCHSDQFNYAKVDKDSFDFNPVYREVFKYFRQSDFVFGNLETVTAGKRKGFSGYPLFNTPDEFITALYNAGFRLLTTSSNHSLDKGETGLLRTINQIRKNNLLCNGTYSSREERDKIKIINIKGIKISFLSYTYGTNGFQIPKEKSYLINLIDFDLIKSDIETARKLGADVVLVYYHFGEEYKRDPTAFQKEVVLQTISFGADIIIGGHPHVLQPVQFYKTNDDRLDTGFVAYSLGNFISNQRWRYSDGGAILNIEITKNLGNGTIHISEVSYIPTWVYKGETEKGNEYVILPLLPGLKSSVEENLTDSDRENMKQAFNDTNEILNRYGADIFLYADRLFLINDLKPRGFDFVRYNWNGGVGEMDIR